MEKTIENAVNFSINDILGVSLDGITYKYDFKVVCTGNVDARKDESKIRTILKELIKEFCEKNDISYIRFCDDYDFYCDSKEKLENEMKLQISAFIS